MWQIGQEGALPDQNRQMVQTLGGIRWGQGGCVADLNRKPQALVPTILKKHVHAYMQTYIHTCMQTY